MTDADEKATMSSDLAEVVVHVHGMAYHSIPINSCNLSGEKTESGWWVKTHQNPPQLSAKSLAFPH